ncbi:MAG: hypothetical protein AAGI44_06315 [Pseudomonadota bacterium]
MAFQVPQGGSNIVHIDVYPVPPENGVAQNWKMVQTSPGDGEEITTLDVYFQKRSTPNQRQSERMIFVFSIAQDAQTESHSWRFVHTGLMYCENEADDLDRLSFEIRGDGKITVGTVKCLSDLEETFNFSFLALCRDNKSGECRILSSADPRGVIRRN